MLQIQGIPEDIMSRLEGSPIPFDFFLTIVGTLLQILSLLIVGYFINRSLDKIYLFISKILREQFNLVVEGKYLQITLKVAIWLIIGVLILSVIPGIGEGTIALLSLGVAAVIAFSSTSIISNTMNGVMLRMIRPFKVGDIVDVADSGVGVITDIGLLHTKIKDAKLRVITVPNSVVMQEEIFNYTKDNYIANAEISIGYKIPRERVEQALIRAATALKLEKPFVLVNKLGDYAVTYQINGLTKDVSNIISIESNLEKAILDEFALEKIEITSPVYHVNRYVEKEDDNTIPAHYGGVRITVEKGVTEKVSEEAIAKEKLKHAQAKVKEKQVVEEIKEEKKKEEEEIKSLLGKNKKV